MSPRKGKFKLFITTPNEAHAIINKTKEKQVLIEYASEPQHDVEKIDINCMRSGNECRLERKYELKHGEGCTMKAKLTPNLIDHPSCLIDSE